MTNAKQSSIENNLDHSNPNTSLNINSGVPKNSRLPKKPTPLHEGLGFGSIEIKEQSIKIARSSQHQKDQKIKELVNIPFLENKPQHSPKIKTNTLNNIVPLEENYNNINKTQRPVSKTNSYIEKKLETTQQSNNKNTQPQKSVREVKNIAPVPRLFAFAAWFIDSIISMGIFIFSSFINYTFFSTGFSPLFNKIISDVFTRFIPSFFAANLQVSIFVVQTFLIGAALIFIMQLLILLTFHSTAGRFAIGIKISDKQERNIFVLLFAALAEVVTLGSLLSVPFSILFPSRVPIFSFGKYQKE